MTKLDFLIWQRALACKLNIFFKLYPSANHLFAFGSGPIEPEEYLAQQKDVAKEVIEDLASWIISTSSKSFNQDS